MSYVVPAQNGHLHFTYNGVDSDNFFKITDIKRSIIPSINDYEKKVPNRNGVIYFGSDINKREIDIDVVLIGQDTNSLQEIVTNIAAWLYTKKEEPLILSDEPDKVYFAHISQDSVINQILYMGSTTLKFYCSDPIKYGIIDITANASNDVVDINNIGTLEAYPIIDVVFNQAASFYAVMTANKYVIVGTPEKATDSYVNQFPLVLQDKCTDTSTWQTGSTVEPGCVITGSYIVNPSIGGFQPSSYGTGSGWHGPALKRGLTTPLQDFRVDIYGINFNSIGQIGAFCLYLLDANNNCIGKIEITDSEPNARRSVVKAMAGGFTNGYQFMYSVGYYNGYYNDFYGMLRIERQGQQWHAAVYFDLSNQGQYLHNLAIGKGPNGETITDYGAIAWAQNELLSHDYTSNNGTLTLYREFYWSDINNQYQTPLAQIQIYNAVYGNYVNTSMRVDKVEVYQLVNISSGQSGQIFQPGDTLKIDCNKAVVYKNNKLFMQYLDLGSDFFSIPPGESKISIEPKQVADTTVTITPRWL